MLASTDLSLPAAPFQPHSTEMRGAAKPASLEMRDPRSCRSLHTPAAVWTLAALMIVTASVFVEGGCRSCRPGGGTPAGDTEAAERRGAPFESEEMREAAGEARLRQQAQDSLAAYRAPSCAAAVAKLEGLLRRGGARWSERTAGGSLPDDLLAILSEAELWRDQAAPLCANAPEHARFEELRLLMDAIWRYPGTISKAELDKRLLTLRDTRLGEDQ